MEHDPLSLLPEVKIILETLLAQAEQPGRKRVTRVRLHAQAYDWYYAGSIRYSVNEQVQLLEAKGWLRLHWQKFERGNMLEAIDLVAQQEAIGGLNALLGRTPIHEMRTRMRQLLDQQETHRGWFDSFVSWARTQLDANKSVAPLSLQDLRESQDLLTALSAIADLQSPVFERSLSVRLFKNSKRLEELRAGIVYVLRMHEPDAARYGDDEWALLQAHHINRPPERVPLTGPIDLLIRNTSRGRIESETYLRLEPGLSSISLSEDILRSAVVRACPAKAIITVENLTSFSELLIIRPLDIMAVHTGGFASPSLTAFLYNIRDYRPGLPFFHWGDLDAGGLRILAHLRRRLGRVIPLGMDIATFEQRSCYAQPLTSNDRESLGVLLSEPELADCASLLHHLMKEDLKLEQEAIDAQSVLGQMSSLL
ncbi:MAG TPA: Wadjet anti-phage system protein JetD domain-containing protein [Ktedonobacteraceae bacterium]|nr:Wadjet anti-phage system protein JetD domain-containing protein [Ktedonobacteraceae bacterium]